VKVLDDDSHEHVEHEETDEQQKRDEIQQTPLVVVLTRLQTPVLLSVASTGFVARRGKARN